MAGGNEVTRVGICAERQAIVAKCRPNVGVRFGLVSPSRSGCWQGLVGFVSQNNTFRLGCHLERSEGSRAGLRRGVRVPRGTTPGGCIRAIQTNQMNSRAAATGQHADRAGLGFVDQDIGSGPRTSGAGLMIAVLRNVCDCSDAQPLGVGRSRATVRAEVAI